MSAEKETSINNSYSSGMEFNSFESIRIGLASPEKIRSWSHGEVKKPETINYRTLKPERDGLFCERIFGPTKDWECHCGKYKRFRYKGKVCERCGVEITKSKVRRERMGHIELAAPVSHIWYFKGIPSRLGQMLDIQPRQLESVLYFGAYIVLDDGGIPEIKKKQTLTEKEYSDLYEKYGNDFRAGMGAEAIKELLMEIDLDKLSEELKAEMKDSNGQKKIKLLKRFEVVESFRTSGNRPEWMILDVIPVIPPEIRPMVQLDGGRFATSDLNDLYRRVINRNNRLRKLLELSAPAIIIRNEKRMLQEAVDALIDNGRRGKPVSGPNNRALKSLSDILKGKQGRFRQNLLGKRVDYSGRSVIVVGPELKIYQCGLPKEMALELFKPFVMKRLSELGIVQNIKSAKKMVERSEAPVWDALETVIKEYPVLLNRAPTLHRLGIQAFEPVLVEGRALKLHPLVCTAFNADFDGDQMAVHVPLSAEAQAEARFLMLSANNLLRPQDGMPVTVPSQDMVLGSYYLTIIKYTEPGVEPAPADAEGAGIISAKDAKTGEEKKYKVKIFKDFDEALLAYDAGAVGLHAPIKVRVCKEYNGNIEARLINATVGQIIFNRPIPQDLGFVDRSDPAKIFDLEVTNVAKKSELKKIIDRCIKVHGITKTAEVLDMIKAQGYKYSTKGAITISVSDMEIPPEKAELVHKADVEVEKITKHFRRGLISDDERYAQVVSVWNSTTNEVTKKLQQNLDAFNPINMMAVSGARGSIDQIRQLCGMRGLMANTTGRTVDVPIRANFREGLTVLEYFVSSKGARKGQADTALRTADSGYLTRRLVDVSQDVIVREDDCGSTEGIVVRDIGNGDEIIESFYNRLLGRFPVEDVIDPKTGEVICPNTRYIRDADAKKIVAAGFKELKLRSVLTCECRYGVCAKCYGMNLATSETVNVGEAVGIIAAQSIGEPGTQLTMRTFHTGGVAGSSDITQGLPRVQELFEARHPKILAILSETDGELSFQEMKHARYAVIKNPETGEICQYLIPYGARLKVHEGDFIRKGQELTEGAQDPQDILRVKSEAAVEEYITQEIQKVYHSQAVDINDKHIEIIIRQMMRKVRITEPGDTGFMLGSIVDRAEVKDVNRKLLAANPDAVPAEYQTVLLGITKSALATESFLSAASFQETTKILTDAAIKGKTDMLVGLKENVIIGKLIPAGTGLERYRNVEITELDGSENAG
jgi:DNA-directed RNA polymerase subunit beta'